MPRALIFDIGGVLEITPPTGWEARWAAHLHLPETELARAMSPIFEAGALGRRTLEEVERDLSRALGLASDDVAALMNDAWAEYLGTLNGELVDHVASLRPRYRIALLSNSFVGAREREQAAYGFESLCDLIVYSHEEGILKPDRRIYELTCKRLGVSPSEALFVDDVEENVRGAERAGLVAVAFQSNPQTIAALARHLAPAA